LQKHGVSSTRELLAIQRELEEKLQAVFNIDEKLTGKEKEKAERLKEAGRLARQLTELRMAQAAPLEKKVNKLLAQVGMPNARLKVEIKETPLHPHGGDSAEFLFDANKSGQFLPVRKVASG